MFATMFHKLNIIEISLFFNHCSFRGNSTMIINKIKQFALYLLSKETNAKKLAIATSLGIYIAFSPFVGLHTAMVFLFAWLFNSNAILLFAVQCAINNPWTMVPVYGFDYLAGLWIFRMIGLNPFLYDPAWNAKLNSWLAAAIGISGISFWAFFIGGNLLGIGFAGILYPVLLRIFSYLKIAKNNN